MLIYIIRRIILMIPVLLAVSFISFLVIELPPGDFVDAYVRDQRAKGFDVTPAQEAAWRERYGVDDPVIEQYFNWFSGMLTGDMGVSLALKQPVSDIVRQRVPISALIGLLSFILVNAIAIPIGMLSATRQYSIADYFFTVIGFLGMGIPEFIFAIIMLWAVYTYSGNVNVGVVSSEFVGEPMSLAKFADMVRHLWLPALIAAATGTAGTIRIMRANLLDELEKPYVTVARAKGLPRRRMLYKYPFRMALNPFVVGVAGILPGLISGELIVSITLGIPTLAPAFLQALEQQDLNLAGSIVFIMSTLTVVGILLSDILLAIVDPRIRGAV
jgi:peptide/nickel transport system permease protein